MQPKPGLTGHPGDSDCLRGGHATGERLPSMQMVVICNSIAVQQAEPGLSSHLRRKSTPQEHGASVLSLLNLASAEAAFDQSITEALPD